MATDLTAQTEQIGEGLWRWSVWVETDFPQEIEEVVYTLDSSFFNPVRRSKESASKFRITDVASGSFTVFARIKFSSGIDLKLEQRLHLETAKDADTSLDNKPIILVVDDDIRVCEAVVQDLRRRYRPSFVVLRAASGQLALEILQKLKDHGADVALIVSDQRMPEMLGTAFLSSAAQLFPFAKMMLLTAYLDSESAIDAINLCKVDYYLVKPWDPPEEKLYPIVDELLSAWQPIRGSKFRG